MKNLIQPFAGQSRALAFGLSWHTILGEKLDDVAVKLAIRKRATHYTRGGSRSTVAGLLTLSRQQRKSYSRLTLYSAAAAFARACPRGVVAIRVTVPTGVWVAGASDGVVLTGTDVIHESEAQAQEALQALRERYAELVVYGDGENETPLPPQALVDQMDAATELRQATRVLARVPTPVWVLIGVFVAWTGIQHAWEWYEAIQAERQRAAMQVAQVDPVEAWREALNNWSKTVMTHSTGELKAILSSLGDVPAQAGRWELSEVNCTPVNQSCTAQYVRTHLGDNLSLLNALPQDWTVNFVNLNNALVSWPISGMERRTLNLEKLPKQEVLRTSWSSLYQRLAPALSEIKLSAGAPPTEIKPPIQSREDGRPVAIPFPQGSEISMPISRELSLIGPLRSLYVLELPESTSLERLHIQYASTSQADVSRSILLATLTGKIYAQ